MKTLVQVAMLSTSLGLALGISAPASAETGHYVSSNAVDKCQAFTPGVTNTIRNRVVGAENVGANPIAVACAFELSEMYGASSAIVDNVIMYFRSSNLAPIDVSCSLLPGDHANGLGTVTNNTVSVPAGGNASINFAGPHSVFAIGVNCIIPPNVTIVQTVIRYRNDP